MEVLSLLRIGLITAQAFWHQLASTPPNPTQIKQRYYVEEPIILQMAPLVFKFQQYFTWTCAVMELLYFFVHNHPTLSPFTSMVCPSPRGDVRLTNLCISGAILVATATCIRLDCYKALGNLFTFDLTVDPQHKLVTSRLYQYVRHPAYTGSMFMIAGISLSHLTSGSWATECGPLRLPMLSAGIIASWWAWAISVCVSRAIAEDRQMKSLFGNEWDIYAKRVHWWFFPGVL
ncbi:hypothetical protein BDQ17DRAFT_1240851 [Cyathus striatus]|nr:hypothetical protein BDQ17DRAFT_1240851 [Cyathus striatus]